jgi:hypothetical protein
MYQSFLDPRAAVAALGEESDETLVVLASMTMPEPLKEALAVIYQKLEPVELAVIIVNFYLSFHQGYAARSADAAGGRDLHMELASAQQSVPGA